MKNLMALMVALLSTLLPYSVLAADDAAATVNGQPIRQAWLDVVTQEAKENGRKIDDKNILSGLIRNELLSQEAIRLGIDKRPDSVAWEEIKHRELLANLLVKDYLDKNPASEQMLKAEYDNFKIRLGNKEYNARHIQLKTEAEAKNVIARLAKGEDFAKLAKEKSLDTSSKEKGGLLGWVTKGTLRPPLGDALSKLQKGLFNTVPLQTDLGWHVLKLEDVRDLEAPPYEKIKEQLHQNLRTKQINKLVEQLQANAKIETTK